MRKLASIQRIKSLIPIEGADKIEKATILGWQVVVEKDRFKVGDLCIYCEIDCLMPDRPEFEFLRHRGMRIRTVRLRGQISQGICFSLNILNNIEYEKMVISTNSIGEPQIGTNGKASRTILEDMDITEMLGIIKYKPPITACLGGSVKGNFPSWVPKTDETRVQSLQELLTKYKGQVFYITEKLDGSSVTYYVKDGEFGVCSRNLELKEDEGNSFWKVARELKIEEKLRSLNGNYAIQGELVGEGIQNNKMKLKGQTVYVFNLFDIDKFEYVSFNELTSTLDTLGLKMVPVLERDYILEDDIPTLIKKATIRSTVYKDVWAEGIVLRPLQEKTDSQFANELKAARVSFKAINPEFLLKYE